MKLQANPPPSGLSFGLLTRPPRPEGNGYVELSAPGYCRQAIELEAGAAAYTRANKALIEFGPVEETWAQVTHVAIFDALGAILYYGRIERHQSGTKAGTTMVFCPHVIRVKLPHTIPH